MNARKGSNWRQRMFKSVWLGQMGKCEQCGERERFIFRQCGRSGAFDQGDYQTIIYRTSNLELDHIIPLHLGGSNDIENLQLLCVDCHKDKTAGEVATRAKERRQELGRQILRLPV